MRNQDSLMNDVRHALEEADSNGFQRGFAAGRKALARELEAVLRPGAVAQEDSALCPCTHDKDDHGPRGCSRPGCMCLSAWLRWRDRAKPPNTYAREGRFGVFTYDGSCTPPGATIVVNDGYSREPLRFKLTAKGWEEDTSLRSAQTGYEHNALNVSVSQRGFSR